MIERFMALFKGNDRNFGRFIPNKVENNTYTVLEPVTKKDFENHFIGTAGVAAVPIMDDGFCWFGAIDIDAHGGGEPDIDLFELDFKVRELDLPLMVCRSKSGGAHVYFFGIEPVKASLIRKALTKWAGALGFPRAEIFPKQAVLAKDHEGKMANGNFINLPFFDWQGDEPLRYGVDGGKKISLLGHFLDLVAAKRIAGPRLIEIIDDSHDESPPCISKMIANGVPGGLRNLALYNITIYLKKVHPETWRDKAYDLNARIFDSPLDFVEAKKVVSSAGRRDYKYKCQEEPCKALCNSALCITKKHGITPDEKSELDLGVMPEFKGLQKIETDPVKWVLLVNDSKIYLGTAEVMDFRRVREAVAEKMTMLIPAMKNERWQVQLNALMLKAEKISAPEEASIAGVIRARLVEFLKKADLNSKGDKTDDRQQLLLGMPTVQAESEGRFIYFRGADFVTFLKKNRSEEMKGANLWLALKEMKIGHKRCRIGSNTVIQIWTVPIEGSQFGEDLGIAPKDPEIDY